MGLKSNTEDGQLKTATTGGGSGPGTDVNITQVGGVPVSSPLPVDAAVNNFPAVQPVSATDFDIRNLVFATDKVDVSGSTITVDTTGLATSDNQTNGDQVTQVSKATGPTSAVMQNAATGSGNGTVLDVTGFKSATIILTKVGTVDAGEITIEGSADGSVFVELVHWTSTATGFSPSSTTSLATWINPQIIRCDVSNLQDIRARISAFSGSGSITAVGYTSYTEIQPTTINIGTIHNTVPANIIFPVALTDYGDPGSVDVIDTDPSGSEFGLVTRNIPSGNQNTIIVDPITSDAAYVTVFNELQVALTNVPGFIYQDEAIWLFDGNDLVTPICAVVDEIAPHTVGEHRVGIPRMSPTRELYFQIRDAAGNERGANVTTGNSLQVALISGQDNVDGGAGATTSKTQRVVVANDQTVPVSIAGGNIDPYRYIYYLSDETEVSVGTYTLEGYLGSTVKLSLTSLPLSSTAGFGTSYGNIEGYDRFRFLADDTIYTTGAYTMQIYAGGHVYTKTFEFEGDNITVYTQPSVSVAIRKDTPENVADDGENEQLQMSNGALWVGDYELHTEQGSDSEDVVGPMVQGLVSDANPTYLPDTIAPYSLTTDARLRVITRNEEYHNLFRMHPLFDSSSHFGNSSPWSS